MKISISKFVRIKEDLKKFRKSIFGKRDKIDMCKKYDVTSDDINDVIKYLAYERKKEVKLNLNK